METGYTDSQSFDKIDFSTTALAKGEYERCAFNNCNFSEADLSGDIFVDCVFSGCNLSLAKVNRTSWRDVQFKDCKMLGIQLGDSNEFGLTFSFDGCVLDHTSFYKMKLKKTIFRNSKLTECDLTDTELSNAIFDNCDLTGTTFDNTNLEKADLLNAYNYSIDPERNRIKKAKFSIAGITGLLDKYDIIIEH